MSAEWAWATLCASRDHPCTLCTTPSQSNGLMCYMTCGMAQRPQHRAQLLKLVRAEALGSSGTLASVHVIVLVAALLVTGFWPAAAVGQEAVSEAESTLHAQIETMERFIDRILVTVYWALGSIITVAVLLIGFGWFVNFRIYERDKENLLDKVTSEVSAKVAEAKNEIKSEVAETSRNHTKAAVDSVLKSKVGPIEAKLSELSDNVLEINADSYFAQAREAQSDNYAMYLYRSGLEHLLRTPYFWYRSKFIDTMNEMEKLIYGGAKLDADDIQAVAAFYKRLPKQFEVNSERMLNYFRSKPSGDE